MSPFIEKDREWHWILTTEEMAVTTFWTVFLTFSRMWTQQHFLEVALYEGIRKARTFGAFSWSFFFHSISLVCGIYQIYRTNVLFDSREQLWGSFPSNTIDESLQTYFLFEFGCNWHNIWAIMVMDPGKRCFRIPFLQQIVKLSIIYLIYFIRRLKVGLVIMVCDDVSDLTFALSKRLYYQRKKAGDFVFVCFALSWILIQLGVFPFVIIQSALSEKANGNQSIPLIDLFVYLLYLSLILQLYWLISLSKMLVVDTILAVVYVLRHNLR